MRFLSLILLYGTALLLAGCMTKSDIKAVGTKIDRLDKKVDKIDKNQKKADQRITGLTAASQRLEARINQSASGVSVNPVNFRQGSPSNVPPIVPAQPGQTQYMYTPGYYGNQPVFVQTPVTYHGPLGAATPAAPPAQSAPAPAPPPPTYSQPAQPPAQAPPTAQQQAVVPSSSGVGGQNLAGARSQIQEATGFLRDMADLRQAFDDFSGGGVQQQRLDQLSSQVSSLSEEFERLKRDQAAARGDMTRLQKAIDDHKARLEAMGHTVEKAKAKPTLVEYRNVWHVYGYYGRRYCTYYFGYTPGSPIVYYPSCGW